MAIKKIGNQTLVFANPPKVISAYSIVGPKEGQGPLKDWFDEILNDDMFQEKTFEKAESKMLRNAIIAALKNCNKTPEDIDFMLGGDLLNQLMSTSYTAREMNIPFFGLYGACSTMTESISLASIIIDGGFADHVIASTSSHFSTAERQFRFPLEHGNQRPPTAQWTVTGTGAVVLASVGNGPMVTHITVGKVVDFGITDANNMGAAMAPAAVDTIYLHLKDTGRSPDFYDMILTGDLGEVGKEIVIDLLSEKGFDVSNVYNDCGVMIFDSEKQDVHSGGSGCGCSASVFCGHIYKRMLKKEIKNVLLISTGALLSTISTQQGESIPGIAHAVAFSIA